MYQWWWWWWWWWWQCCCSWRCWLWCWLSIYGLMICSMISNRWYLSWISLNITYYIVVSKKYPALGIKLLWGLLGWCHIDWRHYHIIIVVIVTIRITGWFWREEGLYTDTVCRMCELINAIRYVDDGSYDDDIDVDIIVRCLLPQISSHHYHYHYHHYYHFHLMMRWYLW